VTEQQGHGEQARAETDLVIVTGVSGGGRSTVARALENVGYYVVDNLPQVLMLDMAELAHRAGGTARRTAMVLDVRSRAFSIQESIAASGGGRREAAPEGAPGGEAGLGGGRPEAAPEGAPGGEAGLGGGCREAAPEGAPGDQVGLRADAGVPHPSETVADLSGAVQALRERGFRPRVVFVDADDDVLIRRFENVRRPHPLQGDGRLADGIAAERVLLAQARDEADVLIDTSHLNVNQLRSRVEELFGGEDARRLRVTVLSFGFKYGLPPDADFVLDARFLPNPYWVPELRDHSGKEEAVSRYVLGQRGASTFVETYARLINATAPGFEREGKRYLTVAVGCTGGKHRSVAIAEELTRRLDELRLVATAQHRDLGRE
jgi:RNase adapter protein RapZ